MTSTLELTSAPDPLDAPPLRWGILGAGGIARTFARQVPAHSSGRVVAVGSRDGARAAAFAAEHGIDRSHGGYGELLSDGDVDAVYVATPHSEHRDHALLAIAAGKHVLVEKAFTRNAAEAREVFAAAEERGVFVMEAMWTRFLPHVVAIRELVRSGAIGEVVALHADHGQRLDGDPAGRLLNPALAGGALLDLGVYPLSFAHDLLGTPQTVVAAGALTETAVDGQETVLLQYAGKTQAVCSSTLWARTPCRATISGTDGVIEIEGPFYGATSFTVTRGDEEVTVRPRHEGGFQYEAAEVARCVAEGRRQSATMSWDETLAVMATMDEVRRQLGVVYPGE
ncbi:Gfo/Idh/MocA family oxidoreductase [Georgenia satyanarayanai]|uniref:Gfo/Idh/MocA family protein n=1 Tax=Georgenia satyanarayanai TaxID=860221 RepID=UPI00203B0C60|nr:Gfo/Idh/MocA family oxidoreductase [Georgenia satyanarayanai]MCM3662558.1 Gfo/Idh/MocA family oxidoreductase [Georgenia satyanarayanai]